LLEKIAQKFENISAENEPVRGESKSRKEVRSNVTDNEIINNLI